MFVFCTNQGIITVDGALWSSLSITQLLLCSFNSPLPIVTGRGIYCFRHLNNIDEIDFKVSVKFLLKSVILRKIKMVRTMSSQRKK